MKLVSGPVSETTKHCTYINTVLAASKLVFSDKSPCYETMRLVSRFSKTSKHCTYIYIYSVLAASKLVQCCQTKVHVMKPRFSYIFFFLRLNFTRQCFFKLNSSFTLTASQSFFTEFKLFVFHTLQVSFFADFMQIFSKHDNCFAKFSFSNQEASFYFPLNKYIVSVSRCEEPTLIIP